MKSFLSLDHFYPPVSAVEFLVAKTLWSGIETRPDTRHKMRLERVLFTFEKKHETDRRTDGQTDGKTDGRTDMTSYRDATAHLKTQMK